MRDKIQVDLIRNWRGASTQYLEKHLIILTQSLHFYVVKVQHRVEMVEKGKKI